MQWFKKHFTRKPDVVAEPRPPKVKKAWFASILPELIGDESKKYELKLPSLPAGVVPKARENGVAMDSVCDYMSQYAESLSMTTGFIGYPLLAELAQISEYRAVAETTANEMLREWIEIKSVGEVDNSDRIKIINDELDRYKVRDVLRHAVELDHLFGRAQIYINIKGAESKRKNPLILDGATVPVGSLVGFKTIEPMWTSPAAYNSNDPTATDFFKPRAWYVLGEETHATRLLTIVVRPVPDMLKPAYNFGGVSMSQLMRPYVERWLRTTESVSDLVHSFSLSGIKTDMSAMLNEHSADGLIKRAQVYNKFRDNRGLMLMDKDTEEFFQFNTPLSGLDALQAQAQEQMAAASHTPLVKLLGITPTGLNANSDGEIAVYYDHVKSLQESSLREPLDKIIALIQLDKFGDVDKSITFDFVPLKQITGAELANIRKTDADRDVAYITAGVVDAEEVRHKLADDSDSGYTSLDVEKVPEMPQGENDEGLDDEQTNITDGQGHRTDPDTVERGGSAEVREATQ